MTTNRTPGPAAEVVNYHNKIVANVNLPIGTKLFTASDVVSSQAQQRLISEIDARLIAAVPDLVAALEELIAEQNNEFHHATEGFNMARAAIAKAKGE